MQNTDFRLCPLFTRPSSLLIHMTCLRLLRSLSSLLMIVTLLMASKKRIVPSYDHHQDAIIGAARRLSLD